MTKRILSLLLAVITLMSVSVIPAALAEEAAECPYSLFVYDLPKGIKKPNEQAGTVHEEHYTTCKYSEEGEKLEEIEAVLYVYTPYGYDPAKQYDILYLMHGIGDNEAYWFGVREYAPGGEKYSKAQQKFTTNVLDNMIAQGLCQGAIVVTPTFMDQYRDEDPAAAGSTARLIRFAYQMKNDIIPFVESKYATFAGGDVTPENLIATRDHRGYAGLSMGSMTGFQAIWTSCVEYFAYIGNFSGCDPQGTGIAETVAELLNTKYADYGIRYWYNGNGTKDSVRDDHLAGYALILDKCADKFHEGEDYLNGDNCILVDKPDKGHAYNAWIVDLYNVMSVFFKVP